MYDVLKDFAGPAVTVMAALAALTVTVYFNRRLTTIAEAQRDIAAAQKDIAIDRLGRDLFEKRYEVYIAAKSLMRCALVYGHEKMSAERIVELKIKLDEARFFFPADMQALAQQIEHMCEDLMLRTDQRALMNSNDQPLWKQSGDELAVRQGNLHRVYAELPSLFQRDLRSDLLAGD